MRMPGIMNVSFDSQDILYPVITDPWAVPITKSGYLYIYVCN
jgi:hypothetical protein